MYGDVVDAGEAVAASGGVYTGAIEGGGVRIGDFGVVARATGGGDVVESAGLK